MSLGSLLRSILQGLRNMIHRPAIGVVVSPSTLPVWSTIPDSLNKTAGFTLNLAPYLDPKGHTLTMSLVGSVSGWSLVGTVLTCSGTGTGSLKVRVTYLGVNYDSNSFNVDCPNPVTDTFAPAIPIGLRNIGTAAAPVLSVHQTNDPAPGNVWSGNKDITIQNNGVDIGTVNATSSGIRWAPVLGNIGNPLAGVSAIQTGPAIALACTGGTAYGTTDRFPYMGATVPVGTFLRAMCKVSAWSSSWLYAKLFLQFRASGASNDLNLSFVLFPFLQAQGANIEGRTQVGAQTQTFANQVVNQSPIWFGFEVTGRTSYQPVVSFDGNNIVALGPPIVLDLGANPILMAGIASDDGVTAVAGTIQEISISDQPDLTFTPSVSPGTQYNFTAKARDTVPNTSAASNTLVVTTPGGGGGGAVNALVRPMAYAIGTFDNTYASNPFKELCKHLVAVIISPITPTDNNGNNVVAALTEILQANPTLKISMYGVDMGFLDSGKVCGPDLIQNCKANEWLPRTSYPNGPFFQVNPNQYVFEPYPGGATAKINGQDVTSNQYAGYWFKDALLQANANGWAPSAFFTFNTYTLVSAIFLDDQQANLRYQLDPTRGLPLPPGITDNNDLIQAGLADRVSTMASIVGKECWLNMTFQFGRSVNFQNNLCPPRLVGVTPGGTCEYPDSAYGYCGLNDVQSQIYAANQQCSGNGGMICHSFVQADGSANVLDANGNIIRVIPAGEGDKFWACCDAVFSNLGTHFYPGTHGTPGNDDVFYFPSAFTWHNLFSVDITTGLYLTYPNVNAGIGWSGAPVAGRAGATKIQDPEADGTYRRETDNAYFVLNPYGNGTRNQTFPRNVRIVGSGTLVTAGNPIALGEERGLMVVKA